MDLGLKGKYTLVTGGTHGIGLAIAAALADEGVNVAVSSRTKERVDGAVATLKARGVQVIGLIGDASKLEDIEHVFKAVIKKFKTIHILINNVGGGGSWGKEDVEGTADDVWTEVYAKNALAAARFTVLALPYMRKQKWGRVITIASKHGREGGGRPWFTMAKSAEIALMKTFALDPRYARAGITFNSVAPGNIMIPETGWAEKQKNDPKGFAALLETLPQGRFGTPEEVAVLVAFLCSKQASHITGASIPIDGAETKSF